MPAGLKESDQEGNADLTLNGRASATCLRNWGKGWGTYIDKQTLAGRAFSSAKGSTGMNLSQPKKQTIITKQGKRILPFGTATIFPV